MILNFHNKTEVLIWAFAQLVLHCSIQYYLFATQCVRCLVVSVSNGSNPLERFRVRVGTGTEPWQRFLPHENPDRCHWASFTTKTRHFNLTTLAPIKYLSCDRIMTWSVRRLCSSSRSFTSCIQICDPTTTRRVAIENPRIWLEICPYFTATLRISVGSQIWLLEVKELIKLDNLRIHHVMIRSELKYLIAAKVVGTVQLEPRSGSNPAKNPRVYVRSG